MNHPAMVVVGGTYGEECAFPRRQSYRGSGGRAAALLASLGAQVTLETYVGPQLGPIMKAIAGDLGYTLNARQTSHDIWFRYRFPLGKPTIHYGSKHPSKALQPIRTDAALVFGMIEGRPIVHAKRVIYDPQDGANSRPFESNHSTAEELALVMSCADGQALTGERDPEHIANALIQQSNVTAVVMKCGVRGAFVRTRQSDSWIRPFPTRRVYKIGSGDAFAAAFAFAWLVEGRDAVAAAWFASRIAAAYVELGHEQIDSANLPAYRTEALTASAQFAEEDRRTIPDTQIYLAGPFFHTSEQWMIDEVRGVLMEMGFRVFSPIHDVGTGAPEEVGPADLFGLEQCGVVLAILDGLDAGTIFEVGYARAKGIPVVAVAESVDPKALTMMIGSGCEMTDDLTTGVYAACWHLMGDV
ncbi:PfkB family carbohydrate kinase [Ralstonia solanacearum]|uniref:PfkB family carbohydrate kinase n=1 Tax=Ralstonia solanacearum TaxID=305 RepID=UPI002306471D|nr:PfkB family carbohydrate kinase [Ralstonia solanacearum]MDB0510980.1 PfkB family carbohydrate kinase [Ralstonia solanacearum]MDB0515934.1 PfkB family carbohydrate kinase [Ralstonia solanacearum]